MKKLKFTVDDYIEAKRLGLAYAGKKGSPNTLIGYRSVLTLAERLADMPVAKFDDETAEQILRTADLESYSQSTKNQMIAALKGIFDWGIGTRLYKSERSPMLGVQSQTIKRKLPRILNRDEVERLLVAVKADTSTQADKYHLILSIMAFCGLRINEVLTLRKEKIMDMGVQVVGKGNKEAFVPMKPDLLNRLREYAEKQKRSPFVFYGDSGIASHAPLTTQPVYRVFDRAVELAGLPSDVTPHTLRHSFATHALRVTGRLEVVQDLLRHEDPKTTRFYAQLTNDDLSNEYNKLW